MVAVDGDDETGEEGEEDAGATGDEDGRNAGGMTGMTKDWDEGGDCVVDLRRRETPGSTLKLPEVRVSECETPGEELEAGTVTGFEPVKMGGGVSPEPMSPFPPTAIKPSPSKPTRSAPSWCSRFSLLA